MHEQLQSNLDEKRVYIEQGYQWLKSEISREKQKVQ